VHGLDAEILEIEASVRSSITRGPLKDLDLPRGLIVAAVDHGKKSEVATGDTVVSAGDRAIVFVLPSVVAEAEKLFLS
jgi:trk system potassium uptake protein TrkA